MKKFKDYLKEKFAVADKIIPHDNAKTRKYTEIFENPTSKELHDIYKASDYAKDEARGVIDKKGNLYVWTNDVVHSNGLKLLNTLKNINLNIDSVKLILTDGIPIHIKKHVVYLSEMFHKLGVRKNKELIDDLYNKAKKKNPYLEFDPQSIFNALSKAGYTQIKK
jgi:hypothetical protein